MMFGLSTVLVDVEGKIGFLDLTCINRTHLSIQNTKVGPKEVWFRQTSLYNDPVNKVQGNLSYPQHQPKL
jgi:hypothetical protein